MRPRQANGPGVLPCLGATVAAGVEATPADVAATARLHRYWTIGPGLAKWASQPHPWTALYHHLAKYMPAEEAKAVAAKWFHEVKGYWPGDQRGQNPVGPG